VTFILQRASGRGFALSQVGGNVLRIGRGTNAELRSENPAVALEHALITADVNGYAITDKGSITGTYVNGRPVESARLVKGDLIDIGDLRIEVQVVDPAKPFFARVSSDSATPADEQPQPVVERESSPIAGVGALKAKKIDYVDAYRLRRPYLTKLSLIAILLIITLTVIGEVTKRERQTLFMPGGVSSAHSRFLVNGQSIAKNCNACHDPWKGASGDRCMACHQMDPHAALQRDAPKCIECHMEHRSAAKLASIGDAKCVECHSNLPAHRTQWSAGTPPLPAAFDHISTFDEHPEFTYKPDNDTLRFNHRLHLAPAGVQNDSGVREVLKCESCHKLVESNGKADPIALRFETHCQHCHRLTFDPRFPTAEVPHGGDPQNALGYVAMTYAGSRELLGKPVAEVRRILAQRPVTTTDDRAYVNAQQVVKTKCSKCHDVRREGSRLVLTPPVIRSRWFEYARYTHTQHRSIDCEACHTTARKSAATSDVLLPTRSACEKCHGSHGAVKTASTCLSCHKYHGRSKILTASMVPPIGDGKRMIEPILLLAIGILMLVVAIPVGIFIYQRLVASAPAIPSVKEMQAKAKPETAKIPAMQTPPPDAAAAAAPAPSPAPLRESTIVDPPAPATPAVGIPADSGGKTEMVQWYGMLLCTDGPLAGQRFIIEEEGLYIGREPSLAQIVIHDSRISKRHLRIVPRNGKVMAIDQNSTNGTYLGKAGGQRITEVQLKRGDVLILSDNAASFQYQI
jgi:pSer/pThr/pTyr-binding forkhead associated (FHA) protein